MNVERYFKTLLAKEGGYVNHPADRGGPTNHGITETVARAFGYTGRMEDLTREEATRIYLERYWVQPQFDKVQELSEVIAEELLDTGVNMGPAIAVKFLQRALNVLNQEGKTYPDVTVDGQLGRMTLAALKTFLEARGREGQMVLWRMLNAQQSVRYIEIAERNASQEAFQFGWQSNRVGM